LGTGKYIADLLKTYNCVIIPEFGGFVANYQPAKVHPTQHTFQPPSKLIAFNENLNSNDGLLISHISKAEGIPFEKAQQQVRIFKEECETALKSKEVIVLPKIGKLYLDIENNLQFSRDRTTNFLLQSFGMSTVQFPPVVRGSLAKEKPDIIGAQQPPPKPLPTIQPAPISSTTVESKPPKAKRREKRKGKKRKYRANYYIAAIIVLLAVFVYQWNHYHMSLNDLKNGRLLNSSIVSAIKNIFEPKGQSEAPSTPRIEEVKPPLHTGDEMANNEEVAEPQGANEDELMDIIPSEVQNLRQDEVIEDVADQSIESNTPEIAESASKIEKVIKKKVPEKVSKASKGFYIILGAFKEKKNAHGLLRNLGKQGIKGSLIQGDNGFLRLGIGPFNTKEDAKLDIPKFQANYPGSWVLKN